MSSVAHIVERFFTHIPMDAGLWMMAHAALEFLGRKNPRWQLHGWWALVVPALIVGIPIAGREMMDVVRDGSVKSYFDWISHIIGFGGVIWGVFRLTPGWNRILGEIR